MAEKKHKGMLEVEPQKSSAAQFLTYIASTGSGGEKYEIRYQDENIWMSQKMLAAVYGVEVPNIRVTAGFSSYDGEFRLPLVLAQASPIFQSSCEGKLGIALE